MAKIKIGFVNRDGFVDWIIMEIGAEDTRIISVDWDGKPSEDTEEENVQT